jgi:hypothetical protein
MRTNVRAKTRDLGICPMPRFVFDLAIRINNALKGKENFCHLRAKLAILCNIVARQPARYAHFRRATIAARFGFMQSSGEGEWLHRRFHSAVRACITAGLSDFAPQATFTSLRAEHWTRLGDVALEDAYTLHLNRRSSTSITLYGRFGRRERHDIPFRGATLRPL